VLSVARMRLLMELLVKLLRKLLMKLLKIATAVTADETAEGSHYCDCWRCPPEGDLRSCVIKYSMLVQVFLDGKSLVCLVDPMSCLEVSVF